MSHDYERTVYTADGLEWKWDRTVSLWVCQCDECKADPSMREQLTYRDLENEHGTVSDWGVPRAYGKHSHTRHMDEPAVSVLDLVARASVVA
ncbi:hypothetical protein AB0383_20070 [Amycolatopsis sp. NPDC051373]|uniref:hypothetical protein n=1 Tax=Amycolatopsis sp. NPDC051373 TaxID=3155801 RepID=UPI00344E88B6